MNWQVIALQFVIQDLGKNNWTLELGTGFLPFYELLDVHICTWKVSDYYTATGNIHFCIHTLQIWPSHLFSCNCYMYAFKRVGMQTFFKAASCNIKYPFKSHVLTPIIIVSGLCALLFFALKGGQLAPTEHVRERDKRINMAPVKLWWL